MVNSQKTYQNGNKWQKKVYRVMSEYFQKKGVKNYSASDRGTTPYRHLLTNKDEKLNFINEDIYYTTKQRFEHHKAGDVKRVMQNTVASQTYCFNLFAPLQQNLGLASQLFTNLLNKDVEVKHIEIEFTPNTLDSLPEFKRNGLDESIGDQSTFAGTDADVAIFYSDSKENKGVILVEFKFIEPEFSKCSSFKKEGVPIICNSSNYWDKMVENKITNTQQRFLCGYNKYENWELTEQSENFNIDALKRSKNCPFRYSLNQLWRNMLLAEKVKNVRKLNESHFWVFSPQQNVNYLWNNHNENVEEQFRLILTNEGNKRFKSFCLEDIISLLNGFKLNQKEQSWMSELTHRYLID